MVYDRASRTTTELSDSRLVVVEFTPEGRMVDGIFGGLSLFDPVALAWDFVLAGGSTGVTQEH